MRVSIENVAVGNRAMASVLLLYYHLVREGGITNDQTVYIDPEMFNAKEFLTVEVEDDLEIDQRILREGACVALLCDLNDSVDEEQFQLRAEVKEAFGLLLKWGGETMPEAVKIVDILSSGYSGIDHVEYRSCLRAVFENYVMKAWLSNVAPGKA